VKAVEAGVPFWSLAYANERILADHYARLGVLEPTYEPRATGHVPEMIELMQRLIDGEHAYSADGDVYFDVRSWPAYGSLSGQRLEAMQAAGDSEGEQRKRDPRDFALWKRHKAGEPATASWPTPWGRGRPGWHLECSAMATKYLGPSFDIHGGGVDLRFPHHENEQAQSRAAGFGFARYWMHNAWITTAGEKMSKSLGNSLVIPSVLERFRAIDLRYYLVFSHYRSHVEFSFEALEEAAAAFGRIENYLSRVASVTGEPPAADGRLCADFIEAMDDDLGTPPAVAAIHETVHEGNKLLGGGDSPALRGNAASVRAMLAVLGLDPLDPHWGTSRRDDKLTSAVASLVEGLLEERAKARAAKDFATADAIRSRLAEAGIEIEDTPQGPQWSL